MTLRFATAVALAASFALSACAPDFNPPPDYKGGFLWDSDRSRTIVVGAEDSLYTISRRYDVPVRVIAARNSLQPPYALRTGQTLILDPIRTHRVVGGETVGMLATKYGVPQSLIVEANDLPAPYTLREGQSVWIPDPFTVAGADPLEPPPPRAAPTSTITRVPQGASMGAPVPPPATVPPTPTDALPPVVAAPPQQTAALPPVIQPSAGAAADAASSKFVWPVQGRLISGFGPAGEGLHNDGINIAAPQGAQVRAAGPGTVVYAGSELKGFGNLLLIKHDNGLTTAYAHADKVLVAKGDQVRQGQVVATVGKTGNVNAPQLHFEVRRGTQAVDPQPFLQR